MHMYNLERFHDLPHMQSVCMEHLAPVIDVALNLKT